MTFTGYRLKKLFEKILKFSIPISAISLLVIPILIFLMKKTGIVFPFLSLVLFLFVNFILILSGIVLAYKALSMKSSILHGILLIVIVMSSVLLFLVRLRNEHRYTTWNVDWRMAQSLANSAVVDPSGRSTLDYAFIETSYHTGSSVFAGHVSYFFPFLQDYVLFAFYPLSAIFAIFIFSKSLADFYAFKASLPLLVTIIVLVTPYIGFQWRLSRANFSTLFSSFLINPTLMVGTVHAISLIFLSLYLMLVCKKNINFQLSLILIGSISLLDVKPQFILPFLVLSISTLLLFRSLTPTILSIAILFGFLPTIFYTQVLDNSSQPSFGLGLLSYGSFGTFSLNALTGLTSLFFIILILKKKEFSAIHNFLTFTILVYLFLKSLFNAVGFYAASPDYIEVRTFSNPGFTPESVDSDVKQGFIVIQIFSVLVGSLYVLSRVLTIRTIRIVLLLILLSTIQVKTVFAVNTYLHPESGYEYFNAGELKLFLEEVPSSTLLIVNDFNDPAENFRRPDRGTYWSSLSLHKFYISSFLPTGSSDMNYLNRYRRIHDFFSSLPSNDDISHLKSIGVEYALVHKRCLPFWMGLIRPQFETDTYGLFSLQDFKRADLSSLNRSLVLEKNQKKIYGISKCL